MMLSRWPENEVQPREALSSRAQAIKYDESHPLRVMYVSAPSRWGAEPSASELTAQFANKSLATLRFMHGPEKRRHWLRRLFAPPLAPSPTISGARPRSGQRSRPRQRSGSLSLGTYTRYLGGNQERHH